MVNAGFKASEGFQMLDKLKLVSSVRIVEYGASCLSIASTSFSSYKTQVQLPDQSHLVSPDFPRPGFLAFLLFALENAVKI